MRPAVAQLFELADDEFRERVLRNALTLSHQLKDVPENNLQRMREVVKDSWPDDGVRVHAERVANQIQLSDVGAYAWLTLAPALDLAPTSQQWADLATSGAVVIDTVDWLRRHYTEEAAMIAAQTCDARTAREWGQLLSAIPSEVEVPASV